MSAMKKQKLSLIAATKSNGLNRRQFLGRTSLAVGAATFAFPFVGRVLGANDRINVACIGVTGKGTSDSNDAAICGGNVVAFCDVNQRSLDERAGQFAKDFPNLKDIKQFK